MRPFDHFLRQGLMDANLLQYDETLRQAASEELNASLPYRRERMRLLADPWNWEKERTRPVLRRGIVRGIVAAAAILLLVTAAAAIAVPLWNAFFGGLDPIGRAHV